MAKYIDLEADVTENFELSDKDSSKGTDKEDKE